MNTICRLFQNFYIFPIIFHMTFVLKSGAIQKIKQVDKIFTFQQYLG